jgi:ABC-type uncharacterized transport system permease subunit
MVPKVIWRAPGDLFGGFLFWVWAFGSAADLPLSFHPAAIRASTDVTPFGAISVPA